MAYSNVMCLLVVIVHLSNHVTGLDAPGEADSFPGWLGATVQVDRNKTPKIRRGIDTSKIKQLSAWKPRAYLYEGFLSDAECDHIKSMATPRLHRSAVTNNEDGNSEVSEVRTSSGTFIGKAEDPVIKAVEERISEWTFLPIPNQESLQVLRYTRGQKYEPHYDYFHDPINTRYGGHRYATVLMYLNNVTKGGETVFPNRRDSTSKDDSWSDCAKGFLAVKPRKGDALLFFSMHPDGTPDTSSLHYACPVVEGEKWSAPMWIHVANLHEVYRPGGADASDAGALTAGGCSNSHGMCKTWSRAGECKKNPEYMTQACRKACGAC